MSSDSAGAPRLMRAISPRATSARGMLPEEAARDHVAALAPLWVKQKAPMTLIDNGTQRLRNGATVVKLAQTVGGVPLHKGELRVMMNADGSLAAVSGTLLPQVAKPTFASTPVQAVSSALDKLYGKTREQVAITVTGERGGWQQLAVATGGSVLVREARARREITDVGGKLASAWAVELQGNGPAAPLTDPDFSNFASRRYMVADGSLAVLSDTNLVAHDAFVYRVYAETTGNRRPTDGATQSFAPHPTGIPDGSEPGFASSSLVVMDAFNSTFDSWLPNNATATVGNNVVAFADLDGSASFNEGDILPEVRAGRTLNYRYDVNVDPLATPDQSKAAAVNSFFITNWMHDWWYDSGFTEATGNAQIDNYGRGGVEGDPLVVLAQFGANIGERNNAFMSTPADGASPSMLMLLWTQGVRAFLDGPSGVVRAEGFAAGPRDFALTAEVVAGADATAPFNDGCQPHTANLTGKIALVTFSGVCGSAATVNNAKAAGAIGIILADGELENPRGFAGSAAANIPGIAVGRSTGLALAAAIAAGPVTVTLRSETSGPERDGDFDNGIVAHEWGHYLHHRLAVCESGGQCGGMSEGWGDFNALLMMLREGDNRDGTYAMAGYALADGTPDAAYFGIRRYPYSIDRTKNALSLRHIAEGEPLPVDVPGGGGLATAEVHDVGEIWASQLWEVFNILIDTHGVQVARRRMTDYAVAGLLLTPPEASFTEARDAILAAASALDTDDMLLMAAAFAGRGSGTCAVAPGNEVADNTGVIESGTLAARLEVSSINVTDDGVSCDNDGYLDPGESGLLRVTVVNAGVVASEDVSVNVSSSSPGVRLGAPIRLPDMLPFTSADLQIPVTLLPSAPRNASITINVRAAGQFTCGNGITVGLSTLTGVDEAANTSRLDTVETRLSAWTRTGDGAESLWNRSAEGNGNHTWFGANAGFPSDTQLVSPPLSVGATEPFVVRLQHAYALEGVPGQLFDGGVIEVSLDGGATWADVTTFGVDPGYTGELVADGLNPLAGRPAFSFISSIFPEREPLVLDFGTQFAGQTVQIRFRLGSDLNSVFAGWDIDDIEVSGTTNTPFATLVAEPSTCTARKTVEDSAVTARRAATTKSLDSFDAAVCIAGDAP